MRLEEVTLDKYNKYLRIEVMREFSKKNFSRELKNLITSKYKDDSAIQRKQRELYLRSNGKSKFVLSKMSEMMKYCYEELERSYEDRIELNNFLIMSLLKLGYKVDNRINASDEKFIKENDVLLDAFGHIYLSILERNIQDSREVIRIIKKRLHNTMENTLKSEPKRLKVYRVEIPGELSDDEKYILKTIFDEIKNGKGLYNSRINEILRGDNEIIIKFKTGAVVGINPRRIKDLLNGRVVFEYNKKYSIKKNLETLYNELRGSSVYTKLLKSEGDYMMNIYNLFYDKRRKIVSNYQ